MLIGVDASRALRTRRTGTERYAREIIRHLLQLPEAAEHRWRLYAPVEPDSDSVSVLAPSGTVDVAWRVLPGRRLWTHRTLAREVASRPADVLFVPAHVVPFLWHRRRLPPAVVTIHDLGYHFFPQAHTRSQRLYLEWSTRWSVTAARRVIAVSNATAADLQQVYGVAPNRLVVVHEACPAPKQVSSAEITTVRSQMGLARPYILFIGTIQPRKNVSRLIQAYAQLCQRGQIGCDLVLAGSPGWLNERILQEVGRTPVADKIHLPGYVNDQDLPTLLAGARIFTFPSLFEGFGLPVLEAQSYGVPVMTSTNSSLPEVAGDGALLVDPTDVDAIADAMLRLSQDEALRKKLIEAGYANVKRFSWERAARETLAVLEQAAAEEPAD